MFIAIVGTPSSGKRSVLRYLVEKHGFIQLGLEKPSDEMAGAELSSNQLDVPSLDSLALSSSSTPATVNPGPSPIPSPPIFASPSSLLDYTTRNWLTHHVTTDLRTYAEIEPFLKRPSFLLVGVDGPIRTRWEREVARQDKSLTLDTFVSQHDLLLHGPSFPATLPPSALSHHPQTDFRRVMSLASVSICNNFPSLPALYAFLAQLNLLDEERLRPGWDTYFMSPTLGSASRPLETDPFDGV
ncbi:Deoxycytidine monophosphate (dCMP) deaminase [Saitozyma podzolica]|uniref:Deoxycytidine monophosphate (dCMP) deaminase n=1 Tax=Saitozyma podzolica TaxID=1890683 RepID=A0A427YJD0_9TREE|nr:Deoxycytidine monophosphate (dCMP) deaminase [Saitozyma podzolica]